VKVTAGEKIFKVVNKIFMIILSGIFLLPYWVIFMASFTDEITICKRGFRLIPEKLSLEAYKFILFNDTFIMRSIINTISITIAGTILGVLFTSMFAYPLSRKSLPGRKYFMIYVLITMLFTGGLVPYFLLVRSLGLYNSYGALIIPGIINVWFMILIRNFFMEIPDSLHESAYIDGANDFLIFFRIIIPLSKPVLATITLFFGVAYWNDYFQALLFIEDRSKMPIQLLIRELLSNFSLLVAKSGVMVKQNNIVPEQSTKMATIIVASLPIIMVYPFLQKYFIKGILIGSIKG